MMHIDLLRHGEPVGGSRYRGHTIDDPLSDLGWRQMREGVGSFNDWDRIVTSPLLRCAEFAQQLAKEKNLPIDIDAGLREIGFGEWEGKTRKELQSERAEEYARFYADPVRNTPPGAEPLLDFYARVSSAYSGLQQQHSSSNLLVVAHAGVIRAILTHALGASPACMYNLNVHNGRISRIRYAEKRVSIELLNACL
jgi:probable phosphoglycerate mutase